MTEDMIMELYRHHDWMTLEEEGFLTPGMVGRACELGVISRKVAEELAGWFY